MNAEAQARLATEHPELWDRYSAEPAEPPARKMSPNYKHKRAADAAGKDRAADAAGKDRAADAAGKDQG